MSRGDEDADGADDSADDIAAAGTGDAAGGLTHLDAQGRAAMVDVAEKDVTQRRAVAGCTVRMRPQTAALLQQGRLPKGDAVAVARIAGIQAAKRTWELIPLCHQVALSSVEVELDVDAGSGLVHVTASVRAADRTGVEMEALVAASTAALTVYDLVKAVDRGAVIAELAVHEKSGGRSGEWRR